MEVTGGYESVYLSKELRSKLWEKAEKDGLSRNQIIREALEAHLKQD